ncbi:MULTISPECIES: ferredoxin-type protein NapF [unclassified Rhizobium]|uniref:ferredoxin-type protein NapF n=1 Tax=unclassified Rhizobium TaxID=2613769 RepID=UPI000B53898B|nr:MULTISPECIES: ferredoxin-type protein NapF [unclassified Rhizobium]
MSPILRRQFLSGRRVPAYVGPCPPGASGATIADACTGCGRCAQRCPTGIISMAGGLPFLDFSQGECTFCGECAQACPEPVFSAKRVFRLPQVATISNDCLAQRCITCQSCGEACPEQAIRFRPRIGGPFVPELDNTKCTGCGACLSICPADAISFQALTAEATNV